MEVVGSPQEPLLYSILVMPEETKKCVCPAVTVIDRKGPPKLVHVRFCIYHLMAAQRV